MRRWARDLLLALREIRDSLGGLTDAVHALRIADSGEVQLGARVAALELEMERRHAEAEGLLLKAKGKLDAARAAEERERRIASRSEESEEEQLDALRRAYAEVGLSLDDGDGGEEEGVHPVRNGLAARHEGKSAAFAMKFGPRG